MKLLFLLILVAWTGVQLSQSAPLNQAALQNVQNRISRWLDAMIARAQNEILSMNQVNENPHLPNLISITKPNYKMDVKCFACQEAVNLARILFREGRKQQAIEEFLTYLCKLLHIETDTICNSIIPLFRKEVFFVLEHLVLVPTQICSLLLNDCGEWYNPYDDWNITLPDTPKPPPIKPERPPSGAKVTRILHISDIHFDAQYSPGSWVDCNEPLCCRRNSSKKGDRRAGYWGDFGACDIPYWTVENMMEHITAHDDYDYVYWTGDLPPHDVWKQTREGQIDIYRNITRLFLKHFKKPVYSALGNHESAPVNSFPPAFITGNMSISWLYDELEDSWTNWLDKNQTSKDIKYGAYYTTLIEPGLRLISMNSNYCNNLNFWLLLNSTDPNRELVWLAETLQKAEDVGEKVHIIGHIPPGYPDCLKAWSRNYYRIVNRYENTIAAQFYGHTHEDHFEVFYDDQVRENDIDSERRSRRPVSSVFIAPSVTTFLDMNPGYRIYTVDGSRENSTRMVLDHETYVMNLTEANTGRDPVWSLEYTAREAFGMLSLFPDDMEELIVKLETDSQLWNKFYTYFYKGRPQPCDEKCKTDLICSLRTGSSGDLSFC